jgi:methylenetetrahydrofolate reductase (NADPH)
MLPTIFGCSIPATLRRRVERYNAHPEDVKKVGVQWCLEQCAALRHAGAPSLHFYAARRAPIRDILKQL